jgi:hypothetical protein
MRAPAASHCMAKGALRLLFEKKSRGVLSPPAEAIPCRAYRPVPILRYRAVARETSRAAACTLLESRARGKTRGAPPRTRGSCCRASRANGRCEMTINARAALRRKNCRCPPNQTGRGRPLGWLSVLGLTPARSSSRYRDTTTDMGRRSASAQAAAGRRQRWPRAAAPGSR